MRMWDALTARDMPSQTGDETHRSGSWARRLVTAGLVVGLPGYLANGAGRGSGTTALEVGGVALLAVGVLLVLVGVVVWLTKQFSG